MSKIKCVLIVDDNEAQRSLLGQIVTAFFEDEVQIIQAENGLEALEKFNEFKPCFIFSDIRMPGMCGLEFVSAVRKTSCVPIILLSGDDEETRRSQAAEVGADDFVHKPFGMLTLKNAVSGILSRMN